MMAKEYYEEQETETEKEYSLEAPLLHVFAYSHILNSRKPHLPLSFRDCRKELGTKMHINKPTQAIIIKELVSFGLIIPKFSNNFSRGFYFTLTRDEVNRILND